LERRGRDRTPNGDAATDSREPMNLQKAIGTTDIADITEYKRVEKKDAFIQKGNHNSVGHAAKPIGYPCHP
jgi:hypothetical protein